MSLQEVFAGDIGRVFFNKKDHATKHTWNGKEIHVIADRDQEIAMTGIRESEDYGQVGGIQNGVVEFFIHVPASELAERPAKFDAVVYDGKSCIVRDVGENEGVYEILLSVQKGRKA